MCFFRSSTPPPLVRQSDGSMRGSPGGKNSHQPVFYPVDGPSGGPGPLPFLKPPRGKRARRDKWADIPQAPGNPLGWRGPIMGPPGNEYIGGYPGGGIPGDDMPGSGLAGGMGGGFSGGMGRGLPSSPRRSGRGNHFDQPVGPPKAGHSSRDRSSRHDFANPNPGHQAPLQPQHFSQPQSAPNSPGQVPAQFQAPSPRTGKVREGDPLPTGRHDPLATVSPKLPTGYHGMRQHVPGMTSLNPAQHGRADDPLANFRVMDDIAGLGKDKKVRKRR
jgi:hypothetical protein